MGPIYIYSQICNVYEYEWQEIWQEKEIDRMENEKLLAMAKVYGTRYSQAVTHPSTNRARRCLTSVIGREPVLSTWYGRRRQRTAKLAIYTYRYTGRPSISCHQYMRPSVSEMPLPICIHIMHDKFMRSILYVKQRMNLSRLRIVFRNTLGPTHGT